MEALVSQIQSMTALAAAIIIGLGVVAVSVPVGLAAAIIMSQIYHRARGTFYLVTVSPVLMERYLDAADKIAAQAIPLSASAPPKRTMAARYCEPASPNVPQSKFRPLTGSDGDAQPEVPSNCHHSATVRSGFQLASSHSSSSASRSLISTAFTNHLDECEAEQPARIKARTEHLKGVKIAIMGCIVNGPGEMADADFGYVGGAPNKINLYVGKTPIKFNIPEAEAVERLVDLIKEHGKWVEPE